MNVCSRERFVSQVTKSEKFPRCRDTVLMPPQSSPESVTRRASVCVESDPCSSVMATEPSMEIRAPSTGSPLSNTSTLSVEELVKTAPVIA